MKGANYYGLNELECRSRSLMYVIMADYPHIKMLVACDFVNEGDENNALFEYTQHNFRMGYGTFVTDKLLEGVDESNISKITNQNT
jgi:hypothetical protein